MLRRDFDEAVRYYVFITGRRSWYDESEIKYEVGIVEELRQVLAVSSPASDRRVCVSGYGHYRVSGPGQVHAVHPADWKHHLRPAPDRSATQREFNAQTDLT